jgi:hypothetical protein
LVKKVPIKKGNPLKKDSAILCLAVSHKKSKSYLSANASEVHLIHIYIDIFSTHMEHKIILS